MAIIYSGKGHEILVDDEDYAELSKYTWSVNNYGYAYRTVKLADGRRTSELMHRRILGLERGDQREGDHEKGNRLDNRRSKLRICSHQQNSQNTGKKSHGAGPLKGAHWDAKRSTWTSTIRYQGKNRYLGTFETPELAHEFYCLAADMIHGEFSNHGI
jgi:hypothetical protein